MEVSKDNLESQLLEKQRDLDSLREEFKLFKEETVELEKELEADNQFKEKEIQALKKKLEVAMSKSEESKKEAVQLEKVLDREKENSSKVKAELEALKTQIVQLEQDNEALEVKARHVEFEKKEMKEKIDKLEERIIVERESLTEKFNKSVEELERLRKELEEHKEEVAVLNRKNIESGAGGLEEDKYKIEQQAEDIALLLEEIKGMEKRTEEKDGLIEELKKQIEELNAKIGGQEELENLRQKVSEYEKTIKQHGTAKSGEEGEGHSQVLEEKVKEMEQLQQKLKSTEEQVKSKNSEIEALKSEMKEKASRYEQTIKGLEEKNDVKNDGEEEAYSKIIEQQAKQIEQLQQGLNSLEEQVQAKNTEIEALQQAKPQNEAPSSGNNEELEAMKKKLEESKEEVIALKKKMTEDSNAASDLLEAEKEKRSDQLTQIIDLQIEIERLQKQLKEKDATIKEHKQNAATLAEQLEIKESEAAVEGATIEAIKIELERLGQELGEALKEKSELIRKAEQENLKYSEQFQSTQKEQERTQLEMDKEIICLRLELAQVKEELAALREENKKLKAEISTKQGKIASLEEEVMRVNLRMKKENELQTKDLKAEVTKLKDDNARLKKENKTLKSKVSDRETGIDQLEEELYRMKKSIEEGKDQLIAIEKDLEVSRSEKSDILDRSPLAEEILSPLTKTDNNNNRWLSPELGRSLSQPLTQSLGLTSSLGLRSSSLSPVMEEVNRESSPEKRINPNQTVFKHLYTKIGKLGAPSYLVLDQENREVKISKNSSARAPGKNDKALSFDTLLGKVSEMNLKENVFVSYEDTIEEQVLGKNLFYMIYGPKKTDKKKLKHRILQDFADIFKGIAKRGEYAGKICKLMMRVQDNALNKKAELLRNTTLAHQLKSFGEFYLGYEKSERDLDDFLSQMKQVDTTPGKNVNNYSFAKIKAAPKQIFIEFSIENEGSYNDLTSKPTHGDSEEDGEDPNVNYSRLSDANLEGDESPQQQQPIYLARTKIMLLCTNGVKEESYFDNLNSVDSIIDLVMTDDRVAVAKKEKLMAGRPMADNVVKHFLLTTYPTTQTYKNTFNTISLANKIELVRKDKDSFDLSSDYGLRHSRSSGLQRNSSNPKAEARYQMPIIKISSSPERGQEKSLEDKNDRLETEEEDDVSKKLMYYSKKQQVMKKNMKNVLGMLNTLMTTDQEQGQQLRKSRDSSPNKTNNMTPKTGSQVNSRQISPDKTKPRSKIAARGN